MKLSRRCSCLIWIYLLLEYCAADISLDGEQPVSVWCDEQVLNLIISKLNEINAKVDSLDRKLTDSETRFESLSEKVSNLDRRLYEEVTTQADAQRIQIQKLTNALTAQQTNAKIPTTLAASSTTTFEADIKNLTYLMNNIKTQVEQALKSERNAESLYLNQKLDLILSRDLKYEDNNKQIVSLLNAANSEINSAQEQIKQGFTKIDILSSLLSNMQRNQLEYPIQSTKETASTAVQNLQNSILPFINRMNNGFSDYISSFPSCDKALKSTGKDGVYSLYMPNIELPPFKAYCFQDSEGGEGYIVMQKRKDGILSFYQKWHAYKHGFGDLDSEHWLGLEKVYAMTSKEKYEMRIDIGDRRGANLFIFDVFEIGSEIEKYYLKELTWNNSNGGGSFGGKTIKFTTYDEDNDADDTKNCAIKNKSGWWYSQCDIRSLNDKYSMNGLEYGQDKNAWIFYDRYNFLTFTRILIRPSKKTNYEKILKQEGP